MKKTNYAAPVFEILSLDEDVITSSLCPQDNECVMDTVCKLDWDIN